VSHSFSNNKQENTFVLPVFMGFVSTSTFSVHSTLVSRQIFFLFCCGLDRYRFAAQSPTTMLWYIAAILIAAVVVARHFGKRYTTTRPPAGGKKFIAFRTLRGRRAAPAAIYRYLSSAATFPHYRPFAMNASH
jgi:hypothetical protein